MRTLFLIPVMALGLQGAETPAERMFDSKLSSAQRNDACFELRGQANKPVVAAMVKALESDLLRACAATNLRVAGAVEELRQAMDHESVDVRAMAAQELGSFALPEMLPALGKAAADPNLLVATNGVEGLSRYSSPEVLPYLETLARKGGIVGILALDRMEAMKDPAALGIARGLMNSPQAPDRVAAIRVIGEFGDMTDLPALREIAKIQDTPMPQQRGFGLMPPISLSKASLASISLIERRMSVR